MEKTNQKYRIRQVNCPTGYCWANLRAELRAIWEANIKAWKIDLAYPVSFVRQLISPIVFMLPYLLYGLVLIGGRYSENLAQLVGTGDAVAFIFTGYIMMGFIGTAVWAMGFSMRREQWFGTLEAIYVTPASRLGQVLGIAIHSTIHQGMGTLMQIIFILVTFGLGLKVEGILPALGIFALMMLGLYGFGIVIAALSLILKEGWIVSDIFFSIMSILSPVAYPLTVLPTLAQQASAIFPTTPALIGMRTFLITDYVPEVVGNVFVHLFVLCLVWILFGVFIFHITDKYIRKKGLLKKF